MNRLCAHLVLTIALAATIAPANAGAAARPDPGFGKGNGYVTTPVQGTTALAYAAVVTGGGKLVIAGQAAPKSGAAQAIVARYRANGRLDRGFGDRGVFTTELPKKDGPFIATSIARVQSGGNLLIGGGYGQGSMLALRLKPDGRLDRSFGGKRTGFATVEAGAIAESIATAPDGSIYLGGSDANVNGRPFSIARLTADGELDPGFGTAGIAESIFWDPTLASSAGATGLAPTPDGGVIAAGHIDYIGGDGHGSAGVFQLGPSGQPVSGFGDNGHVEVAFTNPSGGFAQWFPCAMGVDAQGGILVTGDGSAGSAPAILSARLTSAGVPDPAFGAAGDGRAVLPGARNDSDTTCGASVSEAGGLTMGVGPVIAQIDPSGVPSTTFGPGGLVEVKKPKRVGINAVAQPSASRLFVAGSAGKEIYVARFRLSG